MRKTELYIMVGRSANEMQRGAKLDLDLTRFNKIAI